MDIYSASYYDVWNGIYEPGIYDKDTLWKTVHDRMYYGWSRHEQLAKAKSIALDNCQAKSQKSCQIVVSGCNKGF